MRRQRLGVERDFADMERHGVSFIRTGVWLDHLEIFDGTTGQVKERFCATWRPFYFLRARHRIHVNFTFCAFSPRGRAWLGIRTIGLRRPGDHHYRMALFPHAGGWRSSYREGFAFNYPLTALVAAGSRSSLPHHLCPGRPSL